MAIFKDKIVPIPSVKGIIINRSDKNRVLFVKEAPYDARVGYARPKRTTIGYVTEKDPKAMHPTDGYKELFPTEWEKMFGEKVAQPFKYIGMYALTEAVSMKNGIKDIMDASFGPGSNAMMNFVMYSLLHHTSAEADFESKMEGQQLYHCDGFSGTYYEDLFHDKISYGQIQDFKTRWAEQCKKDGVEDVWLCIDGSNDGLESTGVELDEEGNASSPGKQKLISFSYAVTEDGRPVTFDVYRGGLVDGRALRRIISFLKNAGITVKGVILERGFCDGTALRFLNQEQLSYVILVKGTSSRYKKLVEEYGDEIKFNVEYLVFETNVSGVTKSVQIFDDYKHQDYVTLFFDYESQKDQVTSLLDKLNKEMDRCKKILENGEAPVPIPLFADVLTISEDRKNMEIETTALQQQIDEKGLYSLVFSENFTPQKVHRLYQCRNCSETGIRTVKAQVGYGKGRIRAARSVHVRFTIGFIASCVRYELVAAAESLNLSVDEVIYEMNNIYMVRVKDSYVPIQGMVTGQELILEALGSSLDILRTIAKDENDLLAGRTPASRLRKNEPGKGPKKGPKKGTEGQQDAKKGTEGQQDAKKGSGGQQDAEKGSRRQQDPEKEKQDPEEKERKKPGVKPGTKRSDVNKDGTPRKKPGIPKGTKRSDFNKDGSPRKKSGPKPGTKHKTAEKPDSPA